MRFEFWTSPAAVARFTVGAIAACALAACGGPIDHTIDRTVDPCQPIILVPAADTTETERQSIVEAVALWRAVAPLALVVEGEADEGGAVEGGAMVGEPADEPADEPAPAAVPQTIPVRFERVAPMYHGLYQDETGRIFVNRSLSGARERAITVAHELGHAFGLPHTSRAGSVMREANLTVVPSPLDVDELAARWGSCVRDE